MKNVSLKESRGGRDTRKKEKIITTKQKSCFGGWGAKGAREGGLLEFLSGCLPHLRLLSVEGLGSWHSEDKSTLRHVNVLEQVGTVWGKQFILPPARADQQKLLVEYILISSSRRIKVEVPCVNCSNLIRTPSRESGRLRKTNVKNQQQVSICGTAKWRRVQ